MKSLIPRVEALAQSLSSPVPEGEVKEGERRKSLKLYVDTPDCQRSTQWGIDPLRC
jgi:hypothetical protein